MKIRKCFIYIIISIILLSSNVYAKQIKQMNELTPNELIEYGKQLEREEQEREELRRNTQIEVNNKFNALIEQENNEKTFNIIVIGLILFLISIIIIVSILLYKQTIKNSDKYDLR